MSYIPIQGDIILLDFEPQSGHEQKGKRPAIVVSNNTFNKISNIILVCPITSKNSGYPLHINLDSNTKTSGYIMCDQVKSLDIFARNAVFLEKVTKDILDDVIDVLIGIVETE